MFNQAATEQRRPRLRSKLCFFFRSSLIKPGPVFMMSGSVCIVFLDKCQPMTFFEVIYSPQNANAAPAFVRLCSLVRWSFSAIILYISNLTRTCTDWCFQTHTIQFIVLKKLHFRKISWTKNAMNSKEKNQVLCFKRIGPILPYKA